MKKTTNPPAISTTPSPNNIQEEIKNPFHLNEVINFLDGTAGFKYVIRSSDLTMSQIEDGKTIQFNLNNVEKVLPRQDFDGTQFLQVNFSGGTKILITKNLVGFKPLEMVGFDSQKIPKVVTTVDLKSVVRALEDAYEEDTHEGDVEQEILRKVYHSILFGAESVGFDMHEEKTWFFRSMPNRQAATA